MTGPRCTRPPEGAAATAAERLSSHLPVVETERLRLRAPAMADLPAWTRIYTEAFGGPGDEEDAWTEFSYYTGGWLLHGHGLWAVERKADGILVGFVLLGLEWEDDEPELGWMLLPEQRGNGFATEAAAAARGYGETLLGPGRFVSYVDHANPESSRVAERLGARRDARAEAAAGEGVEIWRHGVTQ